jgi:hypothetical protein
MRGSRPVQSMGRALIQSDLSHVSWVNGIETCASLIINCRKGRRDKYRKRARNEEGKKGREEVR